MNDDLEQEEQSSGGFGLDSIYYVLFRRKWIILFFFAVAICAASTLLFVVKPPQYHSEAKLFIRYVVESTTPTAPGAEAPARMLNEGDESIINTEIDILRSLDVAEDVVRAIGAERILAKAGGGKDFNTATAMVRENLVVEPMSRRSVLPILFRHPDPEVAREVLNKIIAAYFKKHAEMHQPVEIFGDFFTQETKHLREQLAKTDQELKEAKSQAGVASLEDARKAYTEQISAIREQLTQALAELAENQVMLEEAIKLSRVPTQTSTNIAAQVPLDRLNEYKRICDRLNLLQSNEENLRLTYTEDSVFVTAARGQIAKVAELKKKLEEEYPTLVNLAVSPLQSVGQPAGTLVDPATLAVRVRALESKTNVLNSQLTSIQAQAAKADEMEAPIVELRRKRELLEADLKRFSASMEQNRIETAMGSGKAPNISIIESPTPPRKMWSKNFLKKLGMVTGGCIFFGFALAFVIEFVLDRSVKRPVDIEKKLHLPLLISIPDISRNGHRHSDKGRMKASRLLKDVEGDPSRSGGKEGSETSGTMAVARWERGHSLRRFCEGLRDRLIVDFEIRNLAHKPKLVAVTSCGRGAGVSSISAGLAAALSETGKGNVLLVDLNEEQGKAQQFHKGKPGRGAEGVLENETVKNVQVNETGYDAGEQPENEKLPSVLPRGFANLMPKLQASDYDYIIFDTPPVSQTSMTPRLAGLMDSVLLVVESGKTNQESVQQANAMLAKSKANVSTVLNKVRTYIPTGLYQEFLNDT